MDAVMTNLNLVSIDNYITQILILFRTHDYLLKMKQKSRQLTIIKDITGQS